MSDNLPNTLYNRVNHLNVKIHKDKMKDLGQVIRKAYKEIYPVNPPKISFTVLNHKEQASVREVAVYPDEFIHQMDQLIRKYADQNKPKRMRLSGKYVPATKKRNYEK